MKIHILGKDLQKISELRKKVPEDFEFVEENPEIVICYGGDGMFLIAERVFPAVPKICIRDSVIGNTCYNIPVEDALKKFLEGDFNIQDLRKIKAHYKGRFETRGLIGINDIVIRNSLPTEAIRFRYRINHGDWSDVLVGDGVVISTPYGSTKGAYFYSIAQKSFQNGLGIAFNNTTQKIEPIYLDEEDNIEIQIVRGLGVLVSDNNRDFINLENEDIIKISLIDEVAKRVVLK